MDPPTPSVPLSIGAEPGTLVENAGIEIIHSSTTPSLPLLDNNDNSTTKVHQRCSNSAQKRHQQNRRRSQILRSSLEGSILPAVPLPFAASVAGAGGAVVAAVVPQLPNVPRTSPAVGRRAQQAKVVKKQLIAARARGQKGSVPCRSLAVADKNFRAKAIFFYRDGDEYFSAFDHPLDSSKMPSLPQTTRTGQSEDDEWGDERVRHHQQVPSTSNRLRINARRASAPLRVARLLGDHFDQQQGVRVPVSKARFRTMDALLDQLNESIPLPFGVRRLHTPYGMTQVSSLDDLKPHGKYIVASGTRQVRGVDLEAMERRRRRREEAQRRWNFQPQQSPTTGGATQSSSIQLLQIEQHEEEAMTSSAVTFTVTDQKYSNNNNNNNNNSNSSNPHNSGTRTTTLTTVDSSDNAQQRTSTNVTTAAAKPMGGPFVPITFKQVFFVLNGHPHRVYRALINPNPTRKGQQLDQLLEEVSHGLQAAIFRLYSFDGDRILSIDQLLQLKDMRAVAVPRHEQLALNVISPLSNTVRPVRAAPAAELSSSSTTFTSLPPIYRNSKKKTSRSSKSSSGASSSTTTNNIKSATTAVETMEFNSGGMMKKQKKSLQNDAMPMPIAAAEVIERLEKVVPKRDTVNNNDQRKSSNGQTMTAKTAHSAVSADSDSGRPRTELENGPNGAEQQKNDDEEEEEEDEEEEDYPEEPEELRAMREAEEKEEAEERRRRRKKRNEEEDGDGEGGREKEEGKEEERKRGKGVIMGKKEGEEEKEGDEKEETVDLAVDEHGQENREGQAVGDEHDKEGDEQAHRDKQAVHKHGQEKEKLGQENEGGQAVDEHDNGKPAQQQQQQPIMLGVYSDELEQILYGEAAVKIQSAWRGYSTRKELKKRQRFGVPPPPQMMVNGARTTELPQRHHNAKQSKQTKTDIYKTNEQHLAAVNIVKPKTPRHDATLGSSSEREDGTHGTEFVMERNKERLSWETATDVLLVDQQHAAAPGGGDKAENDNNNPQFLYTVTVITGNRWAADTEANLYIDMHGTERDSGRLWLKQEFTNWLHATPNGPRFRQNQSDSFIFRLPSRLGTINRLTVGHERRGYGAGVFIDRILVTEDEADDDDADAHLQQQHDQGVDGQMSSVADNFYADCRQFLFLCNRWFDSGQVDAKLERNVRLSAFYMINTIPVDGRVTRGRWEFVLHGGTTDGRGGTSSQLAITGYGTAGQSTTSGLYDSRMAAAPSVALMQVDFGNIGELLKVRVELDGGDGTSPDYFLDFVEFKDLDTDEHFVIMCGKWLRWRSAKKGDQPFRELTAFHIGVEPLPLITYEGKIRAVHSPLSCLIAEEVRLELHGDLGDTGHVLVPLPMNAAGARKAVTTATAATKPSALDNCTDAENADAVQWTDIPFRMEAVSVGRVGGARVHFVPNMTGEQIFEGLITLQNIYKKQNVWPPLGANSSFVFSQIRLTESAHTPYRYVLSRSQLHERRCDQQNHALVKELLITEMEGISTRLRTHRKSHSKKMARKWLLQMTVSEGSTIFPEVFLCWENRALAMSPADTSLSDGGILSYQLLLLDNLADSELFIKVRIMSDGQTFLGSANSVQQGTTNNNNDINNDSTTFSEIIAAPFTYVDKVRICDTANGDELRFPSADCMLQRHSVYELPVVWPDRSPMPILIYSVRIASGPGTDPANPELIVQLNLFGEHGDVGSRTLIQDDQQEQQQQQQQMVVTSAVDQHQQHEQQMPPPLFAPKTSCSFEFEAVSIGDIQSAEVAVNTVPKDADFCWECAEMVITDFRGRSAPFYAFKFTSPFVGNCCVQSANVLPFTDAL